MVHATTCKLTILILCLSSLVTCHSLSYASVFYLDEEGRIVASPPQGVEPLETSAFFWWLNKEEATVKLASLRGGVVLMASSQQPSKEAVAITVSGFDSTITVLCLDFTGEGFNDATFVSPVGGNTGTTLGEQRMNALKMAATIWANRIHATVPIAIEVGFDPLPCSPAEGFIGGLSTPITISINSDGAPRPDTCYVQALANTLAEEDLRPTYSDILIRFNSSLDEDCVPGINWYYGLDGNCPSNSLDFLTVALHEICHGLGFITLVGEDGARFNGYDDAFMVFLRDVSAGKNWPDMNDSERVISAVDTGDLVWTGDNVNRVRSVLGMGLHSTSGQVMLFAPSIYLPASSVSHFSDECYPHQLMEPGYNGVIHELDLCVELLNDIGWSVVPLTSVPEELWLSYE